MGEYNWLRGSFTVKIFKTILIVQGLSISKMKLKEYRIVIIYDPDTGEVKTLEESFSTHYKFEINGEHLELPREMEEYLDKHLDCDILGFS